jgi:Ca-activated chloride channel homolog
VTLQYNQLLRKDRQVTDFLFPLSTAKYTSQPIESVTIRATIETAEAEERLQPTHEVEITRSGENNATVKYEAKNHVPTTDFRLFFDTAKGSLAPAC